MTHFADVVFPALAADTAIARAARKLADGEDVTLAAPAFVRPLLTALAASARTRSVLVVVPGADTAERFARQLGAYIEHDRVLLFPDRADMPWDRVASDCAVVGSRTRALHALGTGRPVVVVASGRSLLRILPPQGSHVFEPLVLAEGASIDLALAVERLVRMGYERVPVASERGQFALRGGTLDVYGADAAYPVRAELFGDEIESLRRYVPSTQQHIGDAGTVEIYPCREFAPGSRAGQGVRRALGREALANETLARDIELIEQGVTFNGVEQYLPYAYRAAASVLDHATPGTLVVVAEPRAVFDDIVRARGELEARGDAVARSLDGLYFTPAEVDLGGRQRLTFLSVLRAAGASDGEVVVRRPQVSGREEAFAAGMRGLVDTGYRVVAAARDRKDRERLSRALVDAGMSVATLEPGSAGLPTGLVSLAVADVPAGYVLPGARLAVVSIDDAFPRAAERRRQAADPTKLTFAFAPGDYVVHEVHGIALLRDIVRQTVLGSERDYLLLEYAKGDRLYVPVEQLDRVTRYVGPEGSAPRVTRLNTADWSKATSRARKAARALAFDLVDLYARRAATAGFAHASDTPWQREMEAAFPFMETPDQLSAIEDVKADMESESPMDRLVCGDVGYGKTEVAIRATFKATQSGMQVMVLCPTTILAQQHYTTFSERFASYPVRVEVLSRFRTRSQQAEALEGFAAGTVDVLIGTHRLLSRDVVPRRLGLVVVDEEQRFGVEHKEHLKNLREQVDVLTLTATPIPRTLQMSLSGVRDFSVIDTPPPDRFPVTVHVGEYDAEVVADAIRRELERGGQVYYISNRVRGIERVVERVRAAVPEARVGVGHGQMSEHQLERVMESFSAGEIDVLVATTIVESGIDNPHTNTLIIDDAHRLGLAQLYQLKGRVGRSHVKAFAYFLFPREQALTDQAYERLAAIQDHAELGSGIKIAMRDLEIRGAGSLLGAAQSGNVSAVGFDLYAQMLREAVSEVRGEALPAHPEVRVDLPVAAFVPEEYVPEVDERVLFYRRLAAAVSPEAVEALAAELESSRGPLPVPARELVAIARIKALAAEVGVTSVALSRHRLSVSPIALSADERGRLAASGAIYLERAKKAQFVQVTGESATGTATRALDAILSAVRGPAGAAEPS
ncbi:MAG: transcription-repair coupling factor [Coriobacteriia bacterium]|nr:transcription-repair coupling factor [Coriobacteriia bacterium]